MFDKREPFQIITKGLNFAFKPRNYEIWSGGKKTKNGIFRGLIECSQDNSKSEGILIKISEQFRELQICETIKFDLCYTSSDRIYLATVPKYSNISEYVSFKSFVSNVPEGFPIITRVDKEFEINEPYVCSVYTIKNNVAKISFSFGNNPRLLEIF